MTVNTQNVADVPLGPPKYLFLDLETTGLDPEKCAVIEIAAVVTDYKFDAIPGRALNALVRQNVEGLKFEPGALKLHAETGLLLEWIRASESGISGALLTSDDVSSRLLYEVLPPAPKGGAPAAVDRLILAGNNVESFDRRFLQRLAPAVCERLHYRTLNVSSVRELVASALDTTADAIKPRGPGQHRAMVDVQFAIEEMKAARALLQRGRGAIGGAGG